MYKAYEFTFADTPASLYGMFVCDIGDTKHSDNPFGNQANIVEKRLANRITPLHYGVRYHDDPLTFHLIFASEDYMDRWQIQEVAQWLTGYQEYQWLTIDQPDMEGVEFHCLIQSMTPITVGWLPIAFDATIVCDCPYGYSYPFEEEVRVDGTTEYLFYNDGTARVPLYPQLKIEVAQGCSSFSIENRTTGITMQFTGMPSGGFTVNIDNENEIIDISSYKYDLYDYFNFQFFYLINGDNELVFRGSGRVTISGRYLYNVGA